MTIKLRKDIRGAHGMRGASGSIATRGQAGVHRMCIAVLHAAHKWRLQRLNYDTAAGADDDPVELYGDIRGDLRRGRQPFYLPLFKYLHRLPKRVSKFSPRRIVVIG